MASNESVIDAGTIVNNKAIPIYGKDIVNKINNICNKISTFKNENTSGIDKGFLLSLEDIENKIKTLSYKEDEVITADASRYTIALEDLYFIDYSTSAVNNLISNFTIVKTIKDKEK